MTWPSFHHLRPQHRAIEFQKFINGRGFPETGLTPSVVPVLVLVSPSDPFGPFRGRRAWPTK